MEWIILSSQIKTCQLYQRLWALCGKYYLVLWLPNPIEKLQLSHVYTIVSEGMSEQFDTEHKLWIKSTVFTNQKAPAIPTHSNVIWKILSYLETPKPHTKAHWRHYNRFWEVLKGLWDQVVTITYKWEWYYQTFSARCRRRQAKNNQVFCWEPQKKSVPNSAETREKSPIFQDFPQNSILHFSR